MSKAFSKKMRGGRDFFLPFFPSVFIAGFGSFSA
jgi:hypothetical protein